MRKKVRRAAIYEVCIYTFFLSSHSHLVNDFRFAWLWISTNFIVWMNVLKKKKNLLKFQYLDCLLPVMGLSLQFMCNELNSMFKSLFSLILLVIFSAWKFTQKITENMCVYTKSKYYIGIIVCIKHLRTFICNDGNKLSR